MDPWQMPSPWNSTRGEAFVFLDFRHIAIVLRFLALGHVLSSLLWAQVNATGSISGEVTDPNRSPVSEARVRIIRQETGTSTITTTDGDGHFSIGALRPGTYSVEISASGFATEIHKNIVIQIQEVFHDTVVLQVGDIRQEITVTSQTSPLREETSELGNVIPERTINQMPLNGRNFSQLALLVPGTAPGPIGGIRTQGNGNETQRAGAEITASGARGSFNLFMIDGLDDRDQSVGTLKVFPNLESIAEFKVQTANYDAAFPTGGAVVNVVTRSGSNMFHGSAFEFFRNAALDARQFFDARTPPYQQNQFGFSAGGPLVKERTFFFGDYQGLRIHQTSTSIISEPTAAMRNGDFHDYPGLIYDPATHSAASNTRQPFANNIIPSHRLSPVAQNLLTVMPLPNSEGFSNNLRITNLAAETQDQYDVRIDQVAFRKDSFFGRLTQGFADISYPKTPVFKDGSINPFAFAQGNATAGSLTLNHAPSGQFTLQETHSFSSSLVNELALGYTRFALQVRPLAGDYNISQMLGLQGSNAGAGSGGLASLTIVGFRGYDSSNLPEQIPQNTWQLTDVVSFARGAQLLRFGGSVVHNGFGFLQLGAPAGSLAFEGVYTNNPTTSKGGSGFADFILGLPDSSLKSALPNGVPYESYSEYGGFAESIWRLSETLTVNLGLRYDLFTPLSERRNRQSDFLLGTGVLAVAGEGEFSKTILRVQKHDFSPRFGLVYRAGQNTVLRAAYGLFYFNEEGTGGSTRLFVNFPFAAQYSVSCSTAVPCLNLATGIPNALSPTNLPVVVYQPISNLTPNIQQWNAVIEMQLPLSLVVRGAYVGTLGRHLNLNLNENVPIPGPGPVAPRRPYPSVSTISAWEPRGPSSYNALQLSAERRLGSGLSFLAAYTYGKSLDEGAGGNSSAGESRINIQNPRNLSADYGLSNFNYAQRFTFSGVYQLPFGRRRQAMRLANSLTQTLFGDWEMTTIFTGQSGAPFSVGLANPTANTGTFTRPDRICDGNLPSSQRSVQRWFDTDCFVAPVAYTFGNAGRNILTGPGLMTLDFGVDKVFPVSERIRLQYRAEFFNLLNHSNFGLPNTSIGSGAAGTITTLVTRARQIQFALRVEW